MTPSVATKVKEEEEIDNAFSGFPFFFLFFSSLFFFLRFVAANNRILAQGKQSD